MSKTDLWRSEFGDEYTERNTITDELIMAREIAWGTILANVATVSGMIPRKFLEVGAGSGVNLIAINNIYKRQGQIPDLFAAEPNIKANKIIKSHDIGVRVVHDDILDLKHPANSMDLVFTSGVLIHVEPDNVLKAMKNIYKVSSKWIVCIEYFSPELRMIPYRGIDNALWARDFGSMYMDNFPLRCLGFGFFWKKVTNLDNVTWWAFEKVN